MRAWEEIGNFSKFKQAKWQTKVALRHAMYFGYYKPVFSLSNFLFPKLSFQKGDYHRILKLRNIYSDKRCFVIGNGPSLSNIDFNKLKNEITIGSNGIYSSFRKYGFHTNFLIIEDPKTANIISKDDRIKKIKNTIKLISIQNAYLDFGKNSIFFRPNYPADELYWGKGYQNFSKEFHHIVYLGGTITYISLQLAFYLGCKEVYLIGVDHGYGEAFERKYQSYQGQAVELDNEAIEILKTTYFCSDYLPFKVGEKVNIPNWDIQNSSYQIAKDTFEKADRKIFNAGTNSNLKVFPFIDFDSLFE